MVANPLATLEYPLAFLFFNGNAAFLDEQGQQICEFQAHGWRGLYLFVEKYPNAPVSIQFANPIPPEMLPYLMRNIRSPIINNECLDCFDLDVPTENCAHRAKNENSSDDAVPALPIGSSQKQ